MFTADVVVSAPLHRQRERVPGPTSVFSASQNAGNRCVARLATRPGSQVDNRRVLLGADVLTTGVTVDACTRALWEAGAESVVGLRPGWSGR